MKYLHYIDGALVPVPAPETTDAPRLVILFSCGITSFVAALQAIIDNEKGEQLPVHVIYTYVANEPDDNLVFLGQVQDKLGIKILVLASSKYNDIYDVQEKTGWIVGVAGARCTKELKWRLRVEFTKPNDIQVFGFDASETDRRDDFEKNNPDVDLLCPLIDNGVFKAQCFAVAEKLGITPPAAYAMGYQNANCIGCVKGGQGYWNKIRVDYPQVFKKQAELERKIGATICKRYIKLKEDNEQLIRDELANANKPYPEGAKIGANIRIPVYLDHLDPNAGRYDPIKLPDCGVICATEAGQHKQKE